MNRWRCLPLGARSRLRTSTCSVAAFTSPDCSQNSSAGFFVFSFHSKPTQFPFVPFFLSFCSVPAMLLDFVRLKELISAWSIRVEQAWCAIFPQGEGIEDTAKLTTGPAHGIERFLHSFFPGAVSCSVSEVFQARSLETCGLSNSSSALLFPLSCLLFLLLSWCQKCITPSVAVLQTVGIKGYASAKITFIACRLA